MTNILITGGAGSIGSEVARRLVRDGHRVTVLDYDEERLWALKVELPEVNIQPGDVADGPWLDHLVGHFGSDSVINCAAKKHVDLCEMDHALSARVNAFAAENLALIASRLCIPCVYVSTDKAIDPSNMLGQSKASGERLSTQHGANVVRFGNVLGTRGSLVPAIRRYAALDKPFPITDPDMTRWFMPISEAVDLILEALDAPERGKVFHPHAPRSARIGDFVDVCRELIAPGHPVEIVGPRPGERTHEYLYVGDELVQSNDPRYLLDRAGIEELLVSSGCLETVS